MDKQKICNVFLTVLKVSSMSKKKLLRLYIYYFLACIYTGVHLSGTIEVGMSSPGDQTGGGDYTPMQSSKGYRSLMSSMSPGWLMAGSMQWWTAETQEVTVICLTDLKSLPASP